MMWAEAQPTRLRGWRCEILLLPLVLIFIFWILRGDERFRVGIVDPEEAGFSNDVTLISIPEGPNGAKLYLFGVAGRTKSVFKYLSVAIGDRRADSENAALTT